MANTFNVASWISMEGLRILTNKREVSSFFNTSYSKEFKKAYAIGDTVTIKKPQRYISRKDSLTYDPQALNRPTTTVTINKTLGIDFEVDSLEKALRTERGQAEFSQAYIAPAMQQLSQDLDSECALWAYQNANNIVGALGTNPTSMDTFQAARELFIHNACPPGDKGAILTPGMHRSIAGAISTVFNPTETVSKAFKDGFLRRGAGFDWYESMSIYQHTAGTWASSVTISGAGQSGSSLLLNCTSGDTFKKGDVISIANVNNVNPATRRSTGATKKFVITADATASGSTVTVSISPAIVGPGNQQQNVSALPANSAALTLFPGTTSPNGKVGSNALCLHKDAFALVSVPLELPTKAEMASQMTDPDSGISIAFIRDFDPVQRKMINRFDCLFGFGNLYPDECAVRVLGA